jgi:hypothetical protein
MKQINEEDQKYIAKFKMFINELGCVQDAYFNDLTKDLDLDEIDREFLFDYIYNFINTEEYPTFADYMARFPNHESENAK